MECGGVPCAISGSSRHGKGKETPFGRVRAPRGEAPVATQGDPLANAWVIRCGPSMNARTTRYGHSPCFRMESMRKRFAYLKGNERKAESTQFRCVSRTLPLPQIRPQHPCVQLCMQGCCCPPRRHHPDAQSFRNHPDMQPFRCNIVGITRPECTKSPPISCLSAG